MLNIDILLYFVHWKRVKCHQIYCMWTKWARKRVLPSVSIAYGVKGLMLWSVVQQFTMTAEQRPRISGDNSSHKSGKEKRSVAPHIRFDVLLHIRITVARVTVVYFAEVEGGSVVDGGGGYIYKVKVTRERSRTQW